MRGKIGLCTIRLHNELFQLDYAIKFSGFFIVKIWKSFILFFVCVGIIMQQHTHSTTLNLLAQNNDDNIMLWKLHQRGSKLY